MPPVMSSRTRASFGSPSGGSMWILQGVEAWAVEIGTLRPASGGATPYSSGPSAGTSSTSKRPRMAGTAIGAAPTAASAMQAMTIPRGIRRARLVGSRLRSNDGARSSSVQAAARRRSSSSCSFIDVLLQKCLQAPPRADEAHAICLGRRVGELRRLGVRQLGEIAQRQYEPVGLRKAPERGQHRVDLLARDHRFVSARARRFPTSCGALPEPVVAAPVADDVVRLVDDD